MKQFLETWGWAIGLIASALFTFLISRGREKPNIEAEIKAAIAHAKTKRLEAEIGFEKAKEQIEEQYAKVIQELDDEQRTQADKLRNNLAARARFYARVLTKRQQQQLTEG